MKIRDLLKNKKPTFSCEFYPPKTEEGMAQLFETVRALKVLDPGYVSVTYGAGGGTKDKTVQIVQKIKSEIGIEAMAHLTCVGHSQKELKEILDQIQSAGIENIIALRGDPPQGEKSFVAHSNGFKNGWQLTEFIRKHYNFCIAVAGYPEGHIEARNKEEDWDYLAQKVKCGADFIVTQLFFENREFFDFERAIRARGITVPIIPGIMPITNFNQILKFTQMCGAKIPKKLIRELEPIQNDKEALLEKGVSYATAQCRELLARGVPGIHFYTLNKSKSTLKIIKNLENGIV